jgi:lipopolysaccharide transport system ATP-binding protein
MASKKEEPIIEVKNLSKQYSIGVDTTYKTLSESLTSAARHPLKTLKDCRRQNDIFWALKDVNFEVERGEVVGIIGRNGAGKSTLLKILSRITSPTEGEVIMRGRVGSLLEVGTGFHPELSGRENIYFNGSILGMKKREIDEKFDEIVKFSGVEKFLDTPVKRYSSGMQVRLAFSVAANLDPEILVVDEVLAVGDASFQKKCLGKMSEVAEGGRTVLFVSHNLDAVSSLCSKGILLDSGSISYQGEISKTISYYNNIVDIPLSVENCAKRGGSGGIKISNVWISTERNEKTNKITSSEIVFLNLEAIVEPEYQNNKKLTVGFGIDSFEGQRLFTCVSSWENKEIITKGEKLEVSCRLFSIPLIPGKYLISASIGYQLDTLDYVGHCTYFEIYENDTSFSINRTKDHGFLNFPYKFDYIAFDNSI